MNWIDFFLCFFFGVFGVHKFREGKVGMGLLYLFTGGLCGIGWIVDCIKYLAAAIHRNREQAIPITTQPAVSSLPESSAESEMSESTQRPMTVFKKCWRWVAIALLMILILASIPSFFGFLALLVIAIILPIAKWQAFLDKYVKSKLRNILAGVLAVVSLFTFPGNAEESIPEVPEPVNPIVMEADETVHDHDFTDASCLVPKTCRTCGAAEGDALGHTWVNATCLRPQHCSVCNAATGMLSDHLWEEATCLVPRTCKVCQTTEGELADHIWQEATCEKPKTCSACGATEGDAAEHIWEKATCEKPKTCTACGTTTGDLGEHDWKEATCTESKTCTVCGNISGEENGHTWKKATCTKPKTCTVCGETSGEANGHKWKDATCKTAKKCSVCKKTTGKKAGHSYSKGKCTTCGKKDPSYTSSKKTGTMVWIPTKGGKKYHSHSGCSNMSNPDKVSLSTAKSRGFTACKKCY